MGVFSIWDDDKVLEMDGGGGGTATWMYLTPLNWTPKNGQNGKSYVHFTTHTKKDNALRKDMGQRFTEEESLMANTHG